MTLENIKTEIIKRADEDFGNNDYKARAESHFKSAISKLLLQENSVFSENDYPALVVNKKLQLGENCTCPDMTPSISSPENIMRLIGAYYFNNNFSSYKSIKIIKDANIFNSIISNVMIKYSEVLYLYASGNSLIAYPYFDNCYMKYIRWVSNDDNVFTGDVSLSFSLRFLYTAIDLAVESFKQEVTVQDAK